MQNVNTMFLGSMNTKGDNFLYNIYCENIVHSRDFSHILFRLDRRKKNIGYQQEPMLKIVLSPSHSAGKLQ